MSLDMTYFNEMEAKHPARQGPHALRSLPHRLYARRQPAHRALHLAHRPPRGRHLHPPHRGYRSGPPGRGRDRRHLPHAWPSADSTTTKAPTSAAPSAPYIQSERRDTLRQIRRAARREGRRLLLLLREDRTSAEEVPASSTSADDPCRDLPLEEAKARVAAGEPYVVRQRIPHGGHHHLPRRHPSATSRWKTRRWTIRCS